MANNLKIKTDIQPIQHFSNSTKPKQSDNCRPSAF